jgi:hypothetical protein
MAMPEMHTIWGLALEGDGFKRRSLSAKAGGSQWKEA